MKPIKFPEANKELLKPAEMTDEQCSSLPIYNDTVVCISCWQPSLKERISIMFFGKVWLWVHSGRTQPPVALEGTKYIFKKGNHA